MKTFVFKSRRWPAPGRTGCRPRRGAARRSTPGWPCPCRCRWRWPWRWRGRACGRRRGPQSWHGLGEDRVLDHGVVVAGVVVGEHEILDAQRHVVERIGAGAGVGPGLADQAAGGLDEQAHAAIDGEVGRALLLDGAGDAARAAVLHVAQALGGHAPLADRRSGKRRARVTPEAAQQAPAHRHGPVTSMKAMPGPDPPTPTARRVRPGNRSMPVTKLPSDIALRYCGLKYRQIGR